MLNWLWNALDWLPAPIPPLGLSDEELSPSPPSCVDFKTIFESTPGHYLILDTNFNIVAANDAYLVMTKRTRDVIGKNIFDVFPESDESKSIDVLRASFLRVLETSKRDVMACTRYDVLLSDGSFETRYWTPVNTPAFNEAGKVMYIIHCAEDVTPLMMAKDKMASLDENLDRQKNALFSTLEELKRAKEAAEQANKSKTVFFNNVSHEFRTPITLILGHLENLSYLEKSVFPARGLDSLKAIRRNALRLSKLVTSLLDFARLEANCLEAYYQPVDFSQLTAELASSFSSEIARSGLAYKINIQPLSQKVYVDRDMWEKVVLNLISNAFKYTNQGSIMVSTKEYHDSAELTVSDTGIGIPQADLPNIFKRFYTVGHSKGRSIEGMGIGLSLVNEIVSLHKGEIKVDSTFGKGTTFSVKIPFGTAHLPENKLRQKESTTTCENTKYSAEAHLNDFEMWTQTPIHDTVSFENNLPRILVVDDNKDMRQLIANHLAPHYQLILAEDGKAGLSKARTYKPELILTDVSMPEMNGFEFLKAIREDEKLLNTPVIMLSAHAGEEALLEGLQASANDYLTKPFSAKVLLARIHTQLELKNLRDQLDRENRNTFIDSICHEVRNSLAIIKGSADLLCKWTHDSSPIIPTNIQEWIMNIVQAAVDQKEILDRVLTIAKLENNPNALQMSNFNPKDLLEGIYRMLKPQTSKKNLMFNIVLPEDEIIITSDSARLKEVLVNLISNAIKFTLAGSITVALEYVHPPSEDALMTLNFTIEDTGIGMDSDELQLLFKRFSQSISSGSKSKGFGLGLAICKEMVASLGGKIWVESKKDIGSKFHFTICAKAENRIQSLNTQTEPNPNVQDSTQPLSILVVDDNTLVRKVLILQLPKGTSVCEASQGKEAVEKFKERKFDIIFMDLRMPIMDGLEATRRIREIEDETHLDHTLIIGISGDARESYGIEAKDHGMDDFFTKPVAREKIEAKIENVQSLKRSTSI